MPLCRTSQRTSFQLWTEFIHKAGKGDAADMQPGSTPSNPIYITNQVGSQAAGVAEHDAHQGPGQRLLPLPSSTSLGCVILVHKPPAVVWRWWWA